MKVSVKIVNVVVINMVAVRAVVPMNKELRRSKNLLVWLGL